MSGKYGRYSERRGISREERQMIHPIWRAVGWSMIILFPIIGAAGTSVLLDLNGKHNWAPIPRDLLIKQSDLLYRIIPDSMILIKAILWVCIVAILFAVFTFISFIITSKFGYTDRRDPYYVAPIKRQRRR